MGQYRYFYNNYVFDNKPRYGLIAAGMSTGFTESILYTPFEIIKIRMQVRGYFATRTMALVLLASNACILLYMCRPKTATIGLESATGNASRKSTAKAASVGCTEGLFRMLSERC